MRKRRTNFYIISGSVGEFHLELCFSQLYAKLKQMGRFDRVFAPTAAFYAPGFSSELKGKLSNFTSFVAAEFYAITVTSGFLTKQPACDVVMLTDALAAAPELDWPATSDPTTPLAHRRAAVLLIHHRNVTIQ